MGSASSTVEGKQLAKGDTELFNRRGEFLVKTTSTTLRLRNQT